MNEPLLGFAVPAFRRPQLLDRALASLVPQAMMFQAPIYIPDNCCGAVNVSVIEKWQAIYPTGIIHEINETNIGIDRNVDQAIARCPAAYVHVIGDDDVIFDGFAAKVTNLLNARAPIHLVCSYVYLTNDYQPITGRPIIPSAADTSSARRFIPKYGWALGFIGSHVFHRSSYVAGRQSAFGSYFNHLARLFGYLPPDAAIGFIPEPLVGNRADDESTPTWSADRLAVVFGLERVIANSMAGIYSQPEIDETVYNARLRLGYAQSVRLLYWAALADEGGTGAAYWRTLQEFMPGHRARLLARVPRALYGPLVHLIPTVRRLKRSLVRIA